MTIHAFFAARLLVFTVLATCLTRNLSNASSVFPPYLDGTEKLVQAMEYMIKPPASPPSNGNTISTHCDTEPTPHTRYFYCNVYIGPVKHKLSATAVELKEAQRILMQRHPKAQFVVFSNRLAEGASREFQDKYLVHSWHWGVGLHCNEEGTDNNGSCRMLVIDRVPKDERE